MSSTRLLIFFTALKCIEITSAGCTRSTYEAGPTYWLKCTNATLSEVPTGVVLSAITMLKSNLDSISQYSFNEHRGTLVVLNLQNSVVRDLPFYVFSKLPRLRKLSLSHNKLTTLSAAWFADLPALEQLDVSFNRIQRVDGDVFKKIPNLRLLNLNENEINCLRPTDIEVLNGLAKIRILDNPMTLQCRGQLTLWLKDHGINYSSERPNGIESWLDSLLWRCAIEDDVIAKSEDKIRRCTVLGMFNQLREAIVSLEDYQDTKDICVAERSLFLSSLTPPNGDKHLTNSAAVDTILSTLAATQLDN